MRRLVAAASWILWQVVAVWRHPLARGRRVRALGSLIRRIVQRKTTKREITVRLSEEVVFACPPEFDSNRIAAVGLPDFEEQSFVLNVMRDGDVAIDVGAYIGSFTVLMAARGARVHAFEPAPATREALERNVDLNGFGDRVAVHAVAVSDAGGGALFTTAHSSGNRLIDQGAGAEETVKVEVTTLDDWSATHDLEGLVLMKVDAEGADRRVLKGAAALRDRFDPAIIVEYWGWGVEMLGWLRSEGYATFRYDGSDRRLVEFGDPKSEAGNVIACSASRAQALNARLASADPVPLRPPEVAWGADGRGESSLRTDA